MNFRPPYGLAVAPGTWSARHSARAPVLASWTLIHPTELLEVSLTPGVFPAAPAGTADPFWFLPPDPSGEAKRDWNTHLRTPGSSSWSSVLPVHRRDGSVRWVQVLAHTTRDVDSYPLHSRGLVVDHTHPRAVERCQAAAREIADLALSFDSEQQFLDGVTLALVATAGFRFASYSRPEDRRGRTPRKSHHPDYRRGAPERRSLGRMRKVAFAGTDTWIGGEVERRAEAAALSGEVRVFRPAGEADAPTAVFAPVSIAGEPDGVLSAWGDCPLDTGDALAPPVSAIADCIGSVLSLARVSDGDPCTHHGCAPETDAQPQPSARWSLARALAGLTCW
jgi:hypothetical protein